MNNWIACGWYTPDYEHWFRNLERSLIEHSVPYHDFRSVPKIEGGWERNTCRKASFVLDALDRHPGKTVIFMDVDCVVTGDLGSLVNPTYDIALNFGVLRKKRRINLVPLTGHMVINPTSQARTLIEAWANVSNDAEFGLQDQETLTLAIGKVGGVEGVRLVRVEATGIICHSHASAEVRKVNGRTRLKNRILSVLDFRKQREECVVSATKI